MNKGHPECENQGALALLSGEILSTSDERMCTGLNEYREYSNHHN